MKRDAFSQAGTTFAHTALAARWCARALPLQLEPRLEQTPPFPLNLQRLLIRGAIVVVAAPATVTAEGRLIIRGAGIVTAAPGDVAGVGDVQPPAPPVEFPRLGAGGLLAGRARARRVTGRILVQARPARVRARGRVIDESLRREIEEEELLLLGVLD